MIDPKTIRKIQQASIAERFRIIGLILESLKQDTQIQTGPDTNYSMPFVVRQFSFRQEVHVDRDELYADSNSIMR